MGRRTTGVNAFKFMQDSAAPSRDLIALNLGSLVLLVIGAILLWRGVEVSRGTPSLHLRVALLLLDGNHAGDSLREIRQPF